MKYLLNLTLFVIGIRCVAAPLIQPPVKAIIAPGTLSSTSATVVWNKPELYKNITRYQVLLNGKQLSSSTKSYYDITGLKPSTRYVVTLRSEGSDGEFSDDTQPVIFTTRAAGKTINITDFGAKGDGITLNTRAIQQAINACPEWGTVRIPAGTFLSGAIFLKSHMTLQIDKNGVLKGSTSDADYLPMINNRFEGWELPTYASLINAGKMDHNGGYSVEGLAIKGEGTIRGGGGALGKTMIDKHGIRSRDRLILMMNCKDVEIQGLQIENPPCWTIHYLYSKGVSLHDLNINTVGIANGDGIDPDSSDDSYIFNCTFATGDDCIAIKSGKNPEGNRINRPTRNVVITDCNFVRGHGISIGSEMSGGVSDVLVRDCKAGALLHGLQIKGTKERGGYVKNVVVADCELQQITIFSALNYNNDGAAAPTMPTFENFVFRNIDLSHAPLKEPVIDINGFPDSEHRLKNVTFANITLPNQAKVNVKDALNINFEAVKTLSGNRPLYVVSNSAEVHY